MIKAIALDDEPPALDVIHSFCARTDYIELTKTFSKAEEAARHLEQFPVDLLFLDINMPSISGLSFAKKMSAQTLFIFTTAHSEFALEGFNLNALDYLLKPFTFERFVQATEKVRTHYQLIHHTPSRPDSISVRADYALVKIRLSEIVMIEGLDDYLKIHLQEGKPVITRMTMKAITAKLPQTDFVRVHRSYIVPLARIDKVRNKTIFIGKEEIPIGNSFEEKFFETFGQ